MSYQYYAKKCVQGETSFIALGVKPDKGKGALEARIRPEQGNSLFGLTLDGVEIIPSMERDGRVFSPGTPVLYPTPNRVRDGEYTYNGKLYRQTLRGELVKLHGLVQRERWSYAPPVADANGAWLESWIDFIPGNDLYEGFPFEHRLWMLYSLSDDGLTISYSVENRSGETIPYGFGLHPFFIRPAEDEAQIKVPAKYVYETTPDLLPTGNIFESAGTPYDLSQFVPVKSLDMDHVLTGLEGNAEIRYASSGIHIELSASEEFTHMVVFAQPGSPIFCVENQSCSTDAHNMYAKGHEKDSGLEFVPPYAQKGGWVRFRIHTEER